MVFITLAGGFVTVWYSYKMERLLTAVTEKELAAFQTAEALEMALANQKGFVSYYFIEGDPEWLRQLGEYRQIFKERLKDAFAYAGSENEKNVLTLFHFQGFKIPLALGNDNIGALIDLPELRVAFRDQRPRIGGAGFQDLCVFLHTDVQGVFPDHIVDGRT